MKILEGFLIGLIVISMLTVACLTIVYDGLDNNPNLVINSSFNTTFDQLQELSNISNDISGQVTTATNEQNSLLDYFSNKLFGTLKLVVSSKYLFENMFTVSSQYLGIPSYIVDGVILIVGILLIAALIYVLFKVKQ